MKLNQSVVILTNFWDANFIIDYGFLLLDPEDKKDACFKIDFRSDEHGNALNFSVHSIALSHPPLIKLPHLSKMTRLDFFCPTYDLLKRYKKDADWDSYRQDYYKILNDRKEDLKKWVSTLKSNHVYFLCCWENTIGKSQCHRELLHKKFLSSKAARTKMISIYRHGDKMKTEGPPRSISQNMNDDNVQTFYEGEYTVGYLNNLDMISDGSTSTPDPRTEIEIYENGKLVPRRDQ